MEELPKLYNEEMPESQKRSKVAIGLITLVLLAMPLGVYLTLQSQNPNSQASVVEQRAPQSSLQMIPRITNITNQSVFPVDVVIQSDIDSANLFATRLSFEEDSLEVVAIASSSADLTDETRIYPATEWIDASYNNTDGLINLVAGIPQQGLKTNPQDQTQQILATIYFKAKKSGETDLLFQEGSMMLNAQTSQNILSNAQSVTLQIGDVGSDFSDKDFLAEAGQFINTASSSATFKIDTPNGGEVFPYQNAVNLRWSQKEATASARRTPNSLPKTVAIAIHMNMEFLGYIGTDIPDTGTYVWNPSNTLPLEFIKPENNFKIEIERVDPVSERKEKIISAGPFILTLNPSTSAQLLSVANLTADKTDVNADAVRDYKDASFMLNNYYVPVTQENIRADFNNDRVINAIDFWYLKQTITQ